MAEYAEEELNIRVSQKHYDSSEDEKEEKEEDEMTKLRNEISHLKNIIREF